MTEDWKLKDKDVIMLMLPLEDGRYIVAKAKVDDKPVESLKDAIIEIPESEGKGRLKYPVVLVRDIDSIKQKLIKDIKSMESNITDLEGEAFEGFIYGFEEAIMKVEIEINKRFGYG